MLLLFAVIAGLAATVLLANQQRNLKTLAQFLGMPIPTLAAGPPQAQTASQARRAPKPVPRWP